MDYIDLREEHEKAASNNGPPPKTHPPYPPYIPAKKSKAPLIAGLVFGGLIFLGVLFTLILSMTLFTLRNVSNQVSTFPIQVWSESLDHAWDGFDRMMTMPVPFADGAFLHSSGLYIWRDIHSGSFEIQLGDGLHIWYDGHSGSFTISGNDNTSINRSPSEWIEWLDNLGEMLDDR
jgi:hypothetical protein